MYSFSKRPCGSPLPEVAKWQLSETYRGVCSTEGGKLQEAVSGAHYETARKVKDQMNADKTCLGVCPGGGGGRGAYVFSAADEGQLYRILGP
jgi:hypothetical protein